MATLPSVFFIDTTTGKPFLRVETSFDMKSIVQKTKVFQKLLDSKLAAQQTPITPQTPQQQQAQFVPQQVPQQPSSPQPELTVAPTPPRQQEAAPVNNTTNVPQQEVPSITAEEVARQKQQDMEDVKKRLAAKYKAERETPIAPPVEQVISATDTTVKISTQSKEKREAMKILNQRIASNQRDLRPDAVGTPVPKTPTTVPKTPTTTTTTTTTTPSSSRQSPFATPTTTIIQLRFPDGSSLKQEFQVNDTLRQVRTFIDTIIGVGHAYNIKTTFPSKTLAETNDTLEQLNLVPNATLAIELVVKRKQASDVSTEAQWGIFACFYGMFAGIFKTSVAPSTTTTTTTTTTIPSEHAPTQPKTKQEKKKFASMTDLQNNKDGDDKSDRDLWNGNSTQFQDKK